MKTMFETNVVKRFPRYRKSFLALDRHFVDFHLGLIEELQILLPKLRKNSTIASELTSLIKRYETSVYNHQNMKIYFDVRQQEIDTISGMLEKADISTSVVVDYGDSSAGNDCLGVSYTYLIKFVDYQKIVLHYFCFSNFFSAFQLILVNPMRYCAILIGNCNF